MSKINRSEITLRDNMRTNLNFIDELANSIKSTNGLLQPVVVSVHTEGKGNKAKVTYTLEAGYRRVAALDQINNYPSQDADYQVPVTIIDERAKNPQVAMVIENLAREGVTSFDFAQELCRLNDEGFKAPALARMLGGGNQFGTSQSNLNNYMRVFRNLPDPIKAIWQDVNHDHNELCTFGNLLKIVKAKDPLAAWTALVDPPTDETPDPETPGDKPDKTDKKPKVKHRKPAEIGDMLSILLSEQAQAETPEDKASFQESIDVLLWVLGRKEDFPGIEMGD